MTSSLGKEIVGVAKLQILFAGIGFLTQIFLARYLGPEQKGVLDLFLLIPVVVASVIDMGLLSANTYFAGKQLIPVQVLHAHSVLWSFFASIALVLLAVAFQSSLTGIFQHLTSSELFFSIALVGPTLYVSLWSALLYGIDRVQTVYRFNVFGSLALLLCYGVIAFVFRLNLAGFLYTTAAFLILKSVAAFFFIDHASLKTLRIDTAALKQSLTYGIALYVGIAINTLHFRIDQFFVNFMRGPADLGLYALAVRIAEMVWMLDYAIINASIFRITASTPEEAVRITQRMARIIGTIVLLASLFISFAAPFAVPLVFGKDFSPSVLPLILLLPGILAWSLARVLGQFIAYQKGKPWENTKAATAAFAINVVLNVLLIPLWGIAGAAIASSISYCCNLVLMARIFQKTSGAALLPTFIPTMEDFRVARQLLTDHLIPSLIKKG